MHTCPEQMRNVSAEILKFIMEIVSILSVIYSRYLLLRLTDEKCHYTLHAFRSNYFVTFKRSVDDRIGHFSHLVRFLCNALLAFIKKKTGRRKKKIQEIRQRLDGEKAGSVA